MEEIKRQIAYKVRINDILNGDYIKQEGWKPSYIKTNFGKISRVNVLATLVGKNEDNSFVIDDGSNKINVRSFEHLDLSSFDVGDIIMVIGKAREWNSQRYIVPEIIKKINDKRWVTVRKLELGKPREYETKIETKEESVENPYDKILNLIKELDSGEGADHQEICEKSQIKNCDDIIKGLLEQGEIFEIRPGKIKILE